jgi:hypothetical protein
MSNLGFSIESNYAASNAARRARNKLNSSAGASPNRIAKPERGAPRGFYLVLATALALAMAFAFPDQVAMIVHHIRALI